MRIHLAPLILVSALCAQPVPHATTIPEIATGGFLGGTSPFPIGRTGGKAQYWFCQAGLPLPTVVVSIGPRPTKSVVGFGRTQSIEITMANTALLHDNFNRNFALNLGSGATVVHVRKNVALPVIIGASDPDVPTVWIALDAPFWLLGPNLVVDWDLGPAASAASAGYAGDLVNLDGVGLSLTSGVSCGGTLAATITPSSYTLQLSGATPAQPAWWVISDGTRNWGGQRLPYALDAFGMAGCRLGVDPQIVVAATVSGAGTASLTIPIATPLVGVAVYAQAVHSGGSTSLGLATTNVARALVGTAWFASWVYNFSVDGSLAQYGPYDMIAPLLIKP